MQTIASLFDEMAAAFQFPDYFGENWAALDECLADLSWLPAAGYVVLIRESSEVLALEDAGSRSLLISLRTSQRNGAVRFRRVKRGIALASHFTLYCTDPLGGHDATKPCATGGGTRAPNLEGIGRNHE